MPVVRPPKRECAQPPPTRTSLAERTRATASAVKLEQGVAIPIILVPARRIFFPNRRKPGATPPSSLSSTLLRHTAPNPPPLGPTPISSVSYTRPSASPRALLPRGALAHLCSYSVAGGTEVALPRKYRLPLLWVQKFMWQSVPLVQPLVSWNHGKWDVLHVARLCYTLICAAREAGERGVTESWRYPTFDRALLRYWHRWLLSRDGFVEDFWKEFGEEDFEQDVLAFDWSAWVLKDHKGFFLTKEEARNGISDYIILIFAVPHPENPPGDSRPLNTLVSGMSHSGGWHYVGVSNQAPPLPEAKSLSKSEKAALMPEFTLFRSPEKQREQVSVSDKRQEQRERASRSQDRPSDDRRDAPAWDVGMGNGNEVPPGTGSDGQEEDDRCEDEDYQEDAHPVTRYAENREQEAQAAETEVNTEIEEDSDLDDDDDDSLELLYPEQSSPEKGKVRSPHPSGLSLSRSPSVLTSISSDSRSPSPAAPPATKPLAHLESTSNSFSQLSLDSSAAPSASNPKQTTQLQLQVSPPRLLAELANAPHPDVNPQLRARFTGFLDELEQEQKRLGLEQRVKALQKDGVGTRWTLIAPQDTHISRGIASQTVVVGAEQRSCAACHGIRSNI
ncbi:hypothetical protein B0H14DRAFT_3530526 [Mycena olivaceomarginata]|nr:hypothetical protein B0H14DRAFT_3530526 [Mycena olivaceomarginata]